MTPPARIVLVGFMGAGKTSVGRLLGARLGWTFVDLDERIAARAGRSVAELFAERGEAAFRELEHDLAREAASLERSVLAAGGGAWAQPRTRAWLQRGAVSVWLDADFETLCARVPPDGSRPLASTRATMRALLDERLPAYRLADLRVDAQAAPEAVAGAIQGALFPAREGKEAASGRGR